MLGDPQEALVAHRDCVALLGQLLMRTLCVPEWTPACPGSDDSRGRGRGKVSALCQDAIRKRTDGHAIDQALSHEQAHFWTLPCVFFLFCR